MVLGGNPLLRLGTGVDTVRLLLPLLGALGLGFLYLSRDSKTPAAPPPPKPSPKPSPMPSKGVYRTALEDAELHPAGLLSSGGKVYTAAPAIDRRTGLYARLAQPDSTAFLERHGMRHIRIDEWDALLASPDVLILKPCTLVHSSADFAHMQSEEYARRHDDCVRKQLEAAGWKGDKILINAGKQYLPDDRPGDGRQLEYGWFQRRGSGWNPQSPGRAHEDWKPIQPPGRVHEDSYTDYSQLTMGVKEV